MSDRDGCSCSPRKVRGTCTLQGKCSPLELQRIELLVLGTRCVHFLLELLLARLAPCNPLTVARSVPLTSRLSATRRCGWVYEL